MSTASTNTNYRTQICDNLQMSPQEATATALKAIEGIQAPEPTALPPIAVEQPQPEISQTMSVDEREILDRMARLDFDLNTKEGGNLVSFQNDYQDYLDDENMLDPE